ncbi:Peroxynitrite isomerase THAP4 [Frankliniella fusca]|uniref:Peroxynitrite isomerase THAP4 n=1 Tax=Frankliniella fusca TaxID=407009 RepID=A0AAE1HC24_9NEOP|nr:Peroxynitrite isomerase THAP4 [Frankliniella fusca]
MSTKCSVPNCHNTTKTGHLLMEFPKDSRMKEFWMEAMKRVNRSPLRKGRICEVHFTRGDWFVCGSKRLLKSTAIPSIFATTTSRKKVLQKKTKCRLADELMLLNSSEVLKGGTKVNVSEQTMVQVERNLVAEHNQLATNKDNLEAELELLNGILSLRELELFEMKYGLDCFEEE